MEAIFTLLVSFMLLHWSSSVLIVKSEKFAYQVKLPSWFVSGALLALGTSLPEVVITLISSIQGYQQLAVGNIVGSNIANICLAFALPWLIWSFEPIELPRTLIIKCLLIQGFLSFCLVFYQLNVAVGFVLVGLFIFALFNKFSHQKSIINKDDNKILDNALLLGSLLILPASSYFIVDSVERLMLAYGMNELFLGSIVLAIGTSIPEIYTTFYAFKKQKYNTAVMNVIGSNILNGSLVASIICFIGGYQTQVNREVYDITFMFVLSAILTFLLLFKRISRLFSGTLVVCYIGYLLSWAI